MITKPVLYLDIDGTVRHGLHELGKFVDSPDDVVIYPEALVMMRRWKAGGGRIIGVSNQGGIALGHVDAAECGAAMARTYELTEGLFDYIAVCPHHPQAATLDEARCWCRKPAPGLVIEAAFAVGCRHRESYPPYMALMVGDRPEDEECARNAFIDFQWATEWREQAKSN